MGLIQDIHDRKLTGCRGCDAVRKGLYKGLDLWKPDSRIQAGSVHDSFNASALGAFVESPKGARGDAALNLGDLFELRTDHRNIVVHTYAVRIFLWGDVASSYDSTLELRVYDGDGVLYHTADAFVVSAYQDLPTNNVKFAAGNRCGALYSPLRTDIGYTSVLYSSSTSVPALPLDSDDISRVDVVITSSGEVLKSFDMAPIPNCHDVLDGNFLVQDFIHESFPQFCLNGPFTGTLGSEQMAVRTALRFNDGPAPHADDGTWTVLSFVVREDSGGLHNADLFYNGTTLFVRSTVDFSGPDLGSSTALPVCSGGTWSGSGGTMKFDLGVSQNPQPTTEPLTFNKYLGNFPADLWLFDIGVSMTYNSSDGS